MVRPSRLLTSPTQDVTAAPRKERERPWAAGETSLEKRLRDGWIPAFLPFFGLEAEKERIHRERVDELFSN
jgi:hypothetical protein